MNKALVVDDSRAVRMIISKTLRDLGYQVLEAPNGREAWEIIAGKQHSFSLLISDWNMPELNGLELLKRVRRDASLSSMRVVMVTTETELGHVATALEAGANEYVMKPFDREILVEKFQLSELQG